MTAARRLAAILAADVVGYSRLMGEDEAGTARAVGEHREAARPIIAGLGGRIVKTTGDGLLLEFPSVVAAVECAIAIQKLMVERNAGTPEDKRVLYRIGVNLGDVLIEGDDILGDGVNIAARLEGVCEPGGVFVSGAAFDHVRGRVDAHFVDLGEMALKNIARPVRVHAVRPARDRAAPAPSASAPHDQGPPGLSIVVLPFSNMSGDPEQEHFVDGVTESLTTDLSRIGGSFVIGRNTAFTYKGRHVDAKQIGRELNVRYILEGSIQRAGARMRVNVQLIDAESGKHLWAERFDKPVADLFDMQDEIVARIANALSAQLFAAEARRAERKPNPDSMDLCFQGFAGGTRASRLIISQRRAACSSGPRCWIPLTRLR
jgi:TolB-like protein/class 3 adenylate cyclase